MNGFIVLPRNTRNVDVNCTILGAVSGEKHYIAKLNVCGDDASMKWFYLFPD